MTCPRGQWERQSQNPNRSSLKRAGVNHDVMWSIHVYRTHKPNLIRKLSEGEGGMSKLTDGINVRQKLYP